MWKKKKTAKLLKLLRSYRQKQLKSCRVIVGEHHIEIKFLHSDETEENWVYNDSDYTQTFRSFIWNIEQNLTKRYGEVTK